MTVFFDYYYFFNFSLKVEYKCKTEIKTSIFKKKILLYHICITSLFLAPDKPEFKAFSLNKRSNGLCSKSLWDQVLQKKVLLYKIFLFVYFTTTLPFRIYFTSSFNTCVNIYLLLIFIKPFYFSYISKRIHVPSSVQTQTLSHLSNYNFHPFFLIFYVLTLLKSNLCVYYISLHIVSLYSSLLVNGNSLFHFVSTIFCQNIHLSHSLVNSV